MPSLVDLTGRTFGRWTVTGRAPSNDAHNKPLWRVTCACGVQREVAGNNLRLGVSLSCGCLHSDQLVARNTTHGLTHSYLYRLWNNMRNRCNNPRFHKFPDYGARGIRVCERWLNDFDAFVRDIGERPTPKHSLDRINNDGHYEPGNVRWATPIEQANNKRRRGTQIGF